MNYDGPATVFEPQIFDQLIEVMGDEGRDLVRSIIDVYTSETVALLERIADSIAQGDSPQLARHAHKLRGSSLSMGASRLAARCTELEDYGLGGYIDGQAERLHRQVATEFSELRVALLAYREDI